MTAHRVAVAARGMAPAALGIALALTAAGLLWLALSTRLTAVGARIDRLEALRFELLERRAEALLAHAAATDPRVLESRARTLGLGPAGPGTTLALPPGSPRRMIGASALAIMLDQRSPRHEVGASAPSPSQMSVATAEAGGSP